jgi:ABC-type nitrate/sulfonate/bicarbonate transport system substrate-binding protein
MSRAGFKPEDYQLVPLVEVPNVLTAIVAGQIDAGALSPPTSFRARKAGLSELVDLSKEGLDYVSVAIGSTRSYVKANEETTRRLIRAYSEAIGFLKSNKAATMRAIQKYARIKDPEILEATYGEAALISKPSPTSPARGLKQLFPSWRQANPRQSRPSPTILSITGL